MTRRSRNYVTALTALGLALLLLGGVSRLFMLRFDRGDIYPPYSTLRADPLGCKAFYESLERCGLNQLSRRYKPLKQSEVFEQDEAVTLLQLGDMTPIAGPYIEDSQVEALETFARRGGRLVVAFSPRNVEKGSWSEILDPDYKPQDEEGDDPTDSTDDESVEEDSGKQAAEKHEDVPEDSESEDEDDDVDDDRPDHGVRFADWLQVKLSHRYIEPGTKPVATRTDEADDTLPREIPCWSSLYFDDLVDTWRVIYERDGLPVVIERRIGRGSYIICADAYVFSNEGLRDDPEPAFLSWAVGAARQVWFDESHHGLTEYRGAAMLARRHNLHWVAFGLLGLAILFIWRNSSSLVPPDPSAHASIAVSAAKGRDSLSGMVNLLDRHLPPSRFPALCLEQWRRSHSPLSDDTRERLNRAEAHLATLTGKGHRRIESPVVTYNRLAEILRTRVTKKKPADEPKNKSAAGTLNLEQEHEDEKGLNE